MKGFLCRGAADLQHAADRIRALEPDTPWQIEVSQYRPRRTVSQNKLLWSIYTEMSEGTGHTPEEIHEAMKAKFLPRRVITVGSEELVVLGSSAQLDTKEFADFVDKVAMFASQELGMVV